MHETYIKWLESGCPKLFCNCPCKKEIIIKRHHKYRGITKYISGHNPCWIKGKRNVYSEETLEKMRKPKTEEHKKKISDSLVGKYCGENSPNFGKPKTQEHKDKISKTRIEMNFRGENSPRYGTYHTEETRQKMRDNHWDCSGENNPNYNREFSDEHRKNISENHADISGENHWNWRGGISKTSYCDKWTEELREEIRIRDGRICQNCGKKENNRKLSVHHIHYKKEDCYPDLITLCCGCNTKANYNRDYWIEFYMKILEKRNLLNYFGEK